MEKPYLQILEILIGYCSALSNLNVALECYSLLGLLLRIKNLISEILKFKCLTDSFIISMSIFKKTSGGGDMPSTPLPDPTPICKYLNILRPSRDFFSQIHSPGSLQIFLNNV